MFRDKADAAVIGILIVSVVVLAGTVVHLFFARSISNLTIEILAAIIAVVMVVASVAVTIHFQARAETMQEYRVELFRQKIARYEKMLEDIAKADDDDEIDDDEIEMIRNHGRTIALYANEELIKELAAFICRLDEERKLYMDKRDGSNKGTFRAVVQAMRSDLDVVEGNDVTEAIGSLVKKDSPTTKSEVNHA
ncbi:MAG: hypothetical protein F4W90_04265 [Gammaproteobacteria bacterium]|nr:hypothetical protein [Gammaproteobacteria bacterium]